MPSITKGQFKSPLLPLAVAGIIVGVAIRTAGLATSLPNLVLSVLSPVYPNSPTGGPNHTLCSRTDQFPGSIGISKAMRTRPSYS